MISRLVQISAVLVALFASHTANAVIIDVTFVEQDLIRVVLTEIDAVDDRVYTIRFDEDGVAIIVFADGAQGATPTSGGSGIASYRFGGGSGGNIVNEYTLTDIGFLFIPMSDFMEEDTGKLDNSFVIFGLSSLTIEYSNDGLRVIDANIASIPEPGTLALFGIGLAGMGLARRRRKV